MTAPSPAGEIAARLEQRFRHIQHERMADFPLINPALEVRAVGLQPWQGQWLGVLITPWFMNLLLLPMDGEAVLAGKVGASRLQAFPSGNYVFTQAWDEVLGGYGTCSLYSPMGEFQDQGQAVAVAEAVLTALLDPGNQEKADGEAAGPLLPDGGGNSGESSEIQRRETGEVDPASENEPVGPHPISRRELLRGVFR